MMQKRWLLLVLLFVLVGILGIFTNPNEGDYMAFMEERLGGPFPEGMDIRIERINFYIFSTYTPIVSHHHGSTYLGVFGNFIRISEGQYDYPDWLELFN